MLTFLLTDVEGSTRLWEERPDDMATALEAHDALLADVVAQHGGELIKSRGEGDSTFSVFRDAGGAVGAAVDGQRELRRGGLRVRMAIHTGDAEQRDGDYFGPTVNRCSRLRSAAHGGQVVLSLVTRQLVADRLADDATLLDLGVHHLRDLTDPEQVFQVCHPELDRDFPPLASVDRRRHNLPTPLTRFIGRTEAVANLDATLDDARLVTLLGPGGVGKTRLAVETARRRVDAYADGVWFVDLSTLSEDAEVIPAVAAALGVRDQPGQSLDDALTAHLTSRTVLAVLDNCEHVLGGAADAAQMVLAAGDHSCVFATSREALRITGERILPVAPLGDADAVQLFLDHAGAVELSAEEHEAIARICRALDGLPLALELAAGQMAALSATQISTRLHDRFELLTTPGRRPDRQRTLSAAIDWSYELLAPDQRDAFAALAVFPADFGLDAAEAVVATSSLDVLGALVGKSLVRRRGERYSMLESIRAYAVERLAGSGQAGRVHDRFVDWAVAVAQKGDLDTIDVEHANVLGGLRWALARRPDDAAAIAVGLAPFWERRGHWTEGRRLLDDVVAQGTVLEPAPRSSLLHVAGRLALSQGDVAGAETLLTQAFALAEDANDDVLVEKILTNLGGVAQMQGDLDQARSHHEAALAISRSIGARRGIAGASGNLGMLALARGELAEATQLYSEAVAMARDVDDPLFLAGVLGNAGMVFTAAADVVAARRTYEEALDIARAHGDVAQIASVQARLGPLRLQEGDSVRARADLAESIRMFRDLGDKPNEANTLYLLGEVARTEDAHDEAGALLRESLELFGAIGYPLGEAAVLLSLGDLDRVAGDMDAAAHRFRQATAMFDGLAYPIGVATALEHLAALALQLGDSERAAELVGSAAAVRDAIGAPDPPPDDRPVDPDAVRAALGAGYEIAWERGRADDLAAAVARGLT